MSDTNDHGFVLFFTQNCMGAYPCFCVCLFLKLKLRDTWYNDFSLRTPPCRKLSARARMPRFELRYKSIMQELPCFFPLSPLSKVDITNLMIVLISLPLIKIGLLSSGWFPSSLPFSKCSQLPDMSGIEFGYKMNQRAHMASSSSLFSRKPICAILGVCLYSSCGVSFLLLDLFFW
jgi:hypothetical protein